MAGRYLATELQDENGDVIYPHTETDIVFGSDGTTVEENLSGEVTDTDMQDVFAGSQPEMNKKLSVKEKIKNALKRYQALLNGKILDTVEEVEANTDDGYLMGAKAGAALINDLGGYSFGETADGKPGYRKPGADAVIPFSNKDFEIVKIHCFSGKANESTGYMIITLKLTDTSKTGIKWTGSANRGFTAQSNCSITSTNDEYQCTVTNKSTNFSILCSMASNETVIFNNIIAY